MNIELLSQFRHSGHSRQISDRVVDWPTFESGQVTKRDSLSVSYYYSIVLKGCPASSCIWWVKLRRKGNPFLSTNCLLMKTELFWFILLCLVVMSDHTLWDHQRSKDSVYISNTMNYITKLQYGRTLIKQHRNFKTWKIRMKRGWRESSSDAEDFVRHSENLYWFVNVWIRAHAVRKRKVYV